MSVAKKVERTGACSSLVAAFAILLASAPFVGQPPAVQFAPIAMAIDASVPQQDDPGTPGSQVRPAEPSDLSVLARWSWFETKLGLAGAKPQVRTQSVIQAPTVPKVTHVPDGHPSGVVYLSSVGTGRRPTGPPPPHSASA
jgi:hypothetical protein